MEFTNDFERQQYLSLSPSERKIYDREKTLDASLSHKELISLAGLNTQINQTFIHGKENINKNDPIFLKKAIEGLGRWLGNRFPEILDAIWDKLKSALDYLGDLIEKGIELVKDAWDWFVDFLLDNGDIVFA